ncbi:hypothetical protein [Phyllobacterium sp. K27]
MVAAGSRSGLGDQSVGGICPAAKLLGDQSSPIVLAGNIGHGAEIPPFNAIRSLTRQVARSSVIGEWFGTAKATDDRSGLKTPTGIQGLNARFCMREE